MRHPSRLLSLLLHRVLMAPAESGGGGGGAAGSAAETDGANDDEGSVELDDGNGDDDDDGEGAPGGAAGEGGQDGKGDGTGADDDTSGELVVTLGDDDGSNDDDAEAAIEQLLGDDQLKRNAFARMRIEAKDLKRQTRDQAQRLRELEAQLATVRPVEADVVVGDKPTMESCDFDPEKFEAELIAWNDRKAKAEEKVKQRKQVEEEQNQRWRSRLADVDKAAAPLKDAQAANETFSETFSPVQMGIVLAGPDDPKTSAMLRYALGKNPTKARELAKIQDPVKFAFAVAKLEGQLKVTNRKSAPAPDTVVRSGTAKGAVATENVLEKLRAEAQKTGDYSKVMAHKRAQADKARKRA